MDEAFDGTCGIHVPAVGFGCSGHEDDLEGFIAPVKHEPSKAQTELVSKDSGGIDFRKRSIGFSCGTRVRHGM